MKEAKKDETEMEKATEEELIVQEVLEELLPLSLVKARPSSPTPARSKPFMGWLSAGGSASPTIQVEAMLRKRIRLVLAPLREVTGR